MKTKLLVIFLTISSLTFASCKEQNQLGNCTLKLGEEIQLDNGDKIRFDRVVEDGRCPKDVECMWAGRVDVQFLVNNKVEIVKGIGSKFETEKTSFTLQKVLPYPKNESPSKEPITVKLEYQGLNRSQKTKKMTDK